MLDIKFDPLRTMVVFGESIVQEGSWLAGNEFRWADNHLAKGADT